MKRKLILLLCLICLGSISAAVKPINARAGESASSLIPNARLAQNRNSIYGVVFDPSGQPVSEIYVELQNEFYSTIGREKTSASGVSFLAGFPPASLKLKSYLWEQIILLTKKRYS